MNLKNIMERMKQFAQKSPKVDVRKIGKTAMDQAQGAYSNYNKFTQNAARAVTSPIRGAAETIGEFTYSPQTLPQDWKYRTKLLADRYQKKNLIQVPYSDKPNGLDQMWENADEKGHMRLGAAFQLNDQQKSPSADYNRYSYQAPPEDAKGAELKRAILSNPAFFPGAKKYFESLSVSADPEGYEQGRAGAFYPSSSNEEYIKYDPRNPKGFDEEVVSHETMHAASDVFGRDKLGEFVADVSRSYQANPEQFEPVMQWMKKYKESRKGTNYFKRDPLQEASELFAQIGAMYGPEMANHPILGQYYSQVFDSNSDAAQPRPVEMIRFEDGTSRPMKETDRIRMRQRGHSQPTQH